MDKLQKITLSRSDRVLLGVCGGLGKGTETPSWIWRVAFVLAFPLGFFNVIAYLVLWNFMPPAPKDDA